MKKSADRAAQALGARTKAPVELNTDDQYLSTGLTLLNLATYGRVDGGLKKGHIYRLVGRSSAGKTFLARTILAEAACNPAFDGYELIYDDVERGALMDTEKFFGRRLVERLVPPARKQGEPIYSASIQDFYNNLGERLEKGRKLIWVEDSMDCLNPEAETKMGDGKAKINAQEMRKLIDPLVATGSILILVSQAHVDLRSMYGEDSASGGRALEFYSTLDIWLRKIETIKKAYKGKQYPVGSLIQARVRKNRLSGQDRMVYFPFHPDIGFDDVGSCVDFLVATKTWSKSKGTINGMIAGTRTELIAHIESKHLLKALRQKVLTAWQDMQAALSSERKSRYV